MWFEVALSSIGDAVIVTDGGGRVVFMNPAAQTVTGWNDDALGKELPEVFHIVDELTRHTAENPFSRVMREGEAGKVAGHSILIKKDGAEVSIEAGGAQVRDKAGNIDGVVFGLQGHHRAQADGTTGAGYDCLCRKHHRDGSGTPRHPRPKPAGEDGESIILQGLRG
jgi:PAS domain S-box-containing protein